MKLSENWLREWVNPTINTQTLCEQLTMLGLEVDSVEAVAPAFAGVVIGEVMECKRHPEADKLQITKVNVGGERLLDVVCGAKNCRLGLKVACATDGAMLPNNFKIKKTKLRGQVSEGMLCSFAELGIEDNADGILELPADAPIGKNIRDYLNLDDNIIEVSLTPNRADCLSIAGIARDLAVLNKMPVNEPTLPTVPATLNEQIAVNVQAPESAPRYLVRLVKGINIQTTTPHWMVEKLRRGGIRSVDAVVDITNYILLEYGQPMHAFDADKITLPLQVRFSKEGEKLTLLDGAETTLKENTLVIADQKEVLAMAGIFGGQHSGVTAHTQNVILESAFFAPLVITGRARQYGLHTESSHRFERGVDFNLAEKMLEKATALLLEICGGEAGEILRVENPQYLPVLPTITLHRKKLDQLLGHSIPNEQVSDILSRLGFAVEQMEEAWQVTPSSWRFDIQIEEDLIEEVARIYGYNHIPNNAPLAHLTIQPHPEKEIEINRLRTAFVDSDYQEIISYSFVDPDIQSLLHPDETALILPNPISKEMSAMRVSLMAGLLNTVIYNQNRQQNRIRLFETGLRFIADENAENGVRQEMVLGAVITGDCFPLSWEKKGRSVDFFDLKGDLERILSLTCAGKSLCFHAHPFPMLHPRQSAMISVAGKEVGFVGTLHPKIAQKLGITGNVIVAEILWSAIAEKNVPSAQDISRFPANKRDLAIVVDEHIPASDVLRVCLNAGGEQLVDVALFDVYQGERLKAGKKSLAISLTIQDTKKTLEEKDVNLVITHILQALETQLNAYLRD